WSSRARRCCRAASSSPSRLPRPPSRSRSALRPREGPPRRPFFVVQSRPTYTTGGHRRMSVIMTFRAAADPDAMERYASEHPDEMQGVIELAQSEGLIAHRFYGGDGQIMVVDEWPDAESFERFMEQAQPKIEPMMGASGMQSEPEVTYWRKLDTGDD